MKNMKIAVSGAGYVGLSSAMLLSQNHEIVIIDIDTTKVQLLNKGISPIEDPQIEDLLKKDNLNFSATMDIEEAYSQADYVLVATPTNYDESTNYFNTQAVEDVIKDVIKINPSSIVIVKSTVPVGFTREIKRKFEFDNIIFSPEFPNVVIVPKSNLSSMI